MGGRYQIPGWVADQLGSALCWATAVTGSPAAACELVAETLAVDARWRNFDEGGDYSRQLGAMALARFAARRRSPLVEPPAGAMEPADRSGGLLAVGPAWVRAAVVCRDGMGATPAEVATTLDRPLAAVERALASHPGPFTDEIDSAAAAGPGFADVQRRYEVLAARRRHRRRWWAAAVSLAAAAAVAAVVVPQVVIPRLPVQPRRAGEWVLSARLDPTGRWTVTGQELSATAETVGLTLHSSGPSFGAGSGAGSGVPCTVTVSVPGVADMTTAVRTAEVSIHGRNGFFDNQTSSTDPLLAWLYAPDSWAVVSCVSSFIGVDDLTAIAESVRFQTRPMRIPFTLAGLPPGVDVSVGQTLPAGDTRMLLEATTPGTLSVQLETLTQSDGDLLPGRTAVVSADGRSGTLRRGGTGVTLCFPVDDRFVCAWANLDSEDAGRQTAALRSLGPLLRIAPSLTDQAGWFDSTTLPNP